MPKKRDRVVLEFTHNCIAAGMTEAMIVRRIVAEKGLNRNSAREYIGIAFKELSERVTEDKLAAAFSRVETMIATDRIKAIRNNNLREQGKAVDRLMRLYGLDRQTVEVIGKGDRGGVAAQLAEQIAGMTPTQRMTREREILEAIGDEEPEADE